MVSFEDLSQPAAHINWRRAGCQCLSFHFQIDLDIGMRGSELDMAQPPLNDSEIYACLKHVHGSCVPKGMGANTFVGEAPTLCCGRTNARSQDMANAEPCKRFSASVHE